MQSDALNMGRFTIKKGGSEWQEQIGKFCDRLNLGRVRDGYEELSPGTIARLLKLSGVSNAEDAYIFYRKCDEFDVFSKGFWYLVKRSKPGADEG